MVLVAAHTAKGTASHGIGPPCADLLGQNDRACKAWTIPWTNLTPYASSYQGATDLVSVRFLPVHPPCCIITSQALREPRILSARQPLFLSFRCLVCLCFVRPWCVFDSSTPWWLTLFSSARNFCSRPFQSFPLRTPIDFSRHYFFFYTYS
jgi:hypothetical protein